MAKKHQHKISNKTTRTAAYKSWRSDTNESLRKLSSDLNYLDKAKRDAASTLKARRHAEKNKLSSTPSTKDLHSTCHVVKETNRKGIWVDGAEILKMAAAKRLSSETKPVSHTLGSIGDQLKQLINQNSDKSGKEMVIGIGDRVWFKFFTTSLNGKRITHIAFGKVD